MYVKHIDRDGVTIGTIFGPRSWAIEPYLAVCTRWNGDIIESAEKAFCSESEAQKWIEENGHDFRRKPAA